MLVVSRRATESSSTAGVRRVSADLAGLDAEIIASGAVIPPQSEFPTRKCRLAGPPKPTTWISARMEASDVVVKDVPNVIVISCRPAVTGKFQFFLVVISHPSAIARGNNSPSPVSRAPPGPQKASVFLWLAPAPTMRKRCCSLLPMTAPVC